MPYTFCPKCGAKVEWGPKCSQCGAGIPLWNKSPDDKKAIEQPEHAPYTEVGQNVRRRPPFVSLAALVVALAVVIVGVLWVLWVSGVIFKSTPSTSTSIASISFASLANPTVYGEPVYGEPVTFIATVSPATSTGTPTGTVTFCDGTTELGSATLSSGQATYTASTLSVGDHSITAVYSGDINFVSSTSDALIQPVLASTSSYPITKVMVDNTQYNDPKGNPIILVENPNAVNPTWAQLLNFLQDDDTDRLPYDNNAFVCANFAQMLQNHAEEAGWRCAWVAIEFTGQSEGHALNEFQTTDKGLVFIDDTGQPAGQAHPSNMDKKVDVEVGHAYTPVYLFPESGWACQTAGVVSKIDVIW